MRTLLAAAEPTRIVVEQGSTPWWPPLVVTLGAAVAAYLATWWFKKRDVDRENAFRAATLVDEAEQIASRRQRYEAEADGGAVAVLRLLQEARVRAEPLLDDELDDRFKAALNYLFDVQGWDQREPVGGRRWLQEAVANIRAGLLPHRAAPRLVPITPRKLRRVRFFPTTAELTAMPRGPNDELIVALEEWKQARGR